MKPAARLPAAGLGAILLCFLAGCETAPQQARIAEQQAAFSALPANAQQAVAKGAIDRGYSLEAVYMALGRPDRIEVSADARECHWVYRNFYYSAAVSNQPLYRAQPTLTPNKAGERAFAGAAGSGRGESPPGMRPGEVPVRSGPRPNGAPRDPAVPAMKLEIVFRDQRVAEVLTEAEAG